MPISAVDAITPAFQHARQQLMQPFRASQWAKLGLVGLLAGEMSSGGGGCNPSAFHIPTPPNHSQRFLEMGLPRVDPAILASLIAVLIVAGLWLVDKIAEFRKAQDCYLSGRRNCAPIEVPRIERD